MAGTIIPQLATGILEIVVVNPVLKENGSNYTPVEHRDTIVKIPTFNHSFPRPVLLPFDHYWVMDLAMEMLTIMPTAYGTWAIVAKKPVWTINGSNPKIAGPRVIIVWIQPYLNGQPCQSYVPWQIQHCWVMEIVMMVTTILYFVIGTLGIAVWKLVETGVGTNHSNVARVIIIVWIQVCPSVHPFQATAMSPFHHFWAMAIVIKENIILLRVDGILATVAKCLVKRRLGTNHIRADLSGIPASTHQQLEVHPFPAIVLLVIQTCWVMENVMEAITTLQIVPGILGIVVN